MSQSTAPDIQTKAPSDKYRMPCNETEMGLYQKDPAQWMKTQIDGCLPEDPHWPIIMQLCKDADIKIGSEKFYKVVAFLALRSFTNVSMDFAKYRNQQQMRMFDANMRVLSTRKK